MEKQCNWNVHLFSTIENKVGLNYELQRSWHWLPSCSPRYLWLPWWKLTTRCILKVTHEEAPSRKQATRRSFLKFGCHRSGPRATLSLYIPSDDETLTKLWTFGTLCYVTHRIYKIFNPFFYSANIHGRKIFR